ncbi:MAG TPA: polyphosphate kinase 2 family protein [Pirellulales bacterium]|nr:polyphosphate kinase 2 family protein [Pirellulales bacterium]
MKLKRLVSTFHQVAAPYCVRNGKKFRLKNIDPADTAGYTSEDKPVSKEALAQGVAALSELQELLHAQDRWAVVLIFQAMDAAGKDGAIKHVMSGVNPQGCQGVSFKAPSVEELGHDYLWRCVKLLPERGHIAVFNRSYYEEVLTVRVHPEFLDRQRLPPQFVTKDIWQQRFEDICHFERYLSRNGVLVLKFFLHVSKKEQKKRFLERIDNSEKNWKFSSSDFAERKFWDDYMQAYEEMIQETATRHAPWYVVPADNKWFTRIVVAAAIIDGLASLDLEFPKVDSKKRAELQAIREELVKN